jgi:hypothetical protein
LRQSNRMAREKNAFAVEWRFGAYWPIIIFPGGSRFASRASSLSCRCCR